MKKLSAFLTALVLCLTLAACGGVSDEPDDTAQSASSKAQTEKTEESTDDESVSESSEAESSEAESSSEDAEESTAEGTADSISDSQADTEGSDAPIDEQTLTDRFYAYFEAIETNDEEAFSEAIGFDVYLDSVKQLLPDEEDAADPALVGQLLDGYIEVYSQTDIEPNGALKNIKWEKVEPDQDEEALQIEYYDCFFSVNDSISGEDIPFNASAMELDGEYFILFQPGEASSLGSYVEKSKITAANINAKTVYISVMEFVTEEEVNGGDVEALASEICGEIDMKNINALSGRIKDIGEMLTEWTGYEGYVYIMLDETADDVYHSIYVQYRDDENSAVGQYPEPVNSVDDPAVWGEIKRRD